MLAGGGRGKGDGGEGGGEGGGRGWLAHLWLARRASREVSTHAVDVAQRDVAAVPSLGETRLLGLGYG